MIRHNKINMMSATLKLRLIKDTHTQKYIHTPAGRLSYVCSNVVIVLVFKFCTKWPPQSGKKVGRKSTVRHYGYALPGCVLDKLAAPSCPLPLVTNSTQYSKKNIK